MASDKTKESNRERAARIALFFFMRDGILRTSLQDVADATGVSLRTLQRYYPTLEELVAEAVRYCVTEQYALCQDAMLALRNENNAVPGIPALRNLLELIKRAFFHHPELFVFLADAELALGGTKCSNRCLDNYSNNYLFIVRQMEECLASGVANGTVEASLDLYTEARYICQSYIGLLVQAALLNRTASDGVSREFCDRSFDYFIRRVLENLRPRTDAEQQTSES